MVFAVKLIDNPVFSHLSLKKATTIGITLGPGENNRPALHDRFVSDQSLNKGRPGFWLNNLRETCHIRGIIGSEGRFKHCQDQEFSRTLTGNC